MSKSFWTPGRDAILRKMVADGTQRADIADRLGCTQSVLSKRIFALRLGRPISPPWPAEHDAILRAEWGKLSSRAIAAKLGRTPNSILGRARRLKLGAISEETARRFMAENAKPYIRKPKIKPKESAAEKSAFGRKLADMRRAAEARREYQRNWRERMMVLERMTYEPRR